MDCYFLNNSIIDVTHNIKAFETFDDCQDCRRWMDRLLDHGGSTLGRGFELLHYEVNSFFSSFLRLCA